MNRLTNYFRHHLWVQIVTVMTLATAAVMGAMIVLNNSSQNQMMARQAHDQAHMLAESVQGAMDEGLSTGNNDAVRAQFRKLKAKLPGVEVAVFDFEGRTSFATNPSWVGKPLDQLVANQEAVAAGLAMLQSGSAPQGAFQETADGATYLEVFQPIANEPRCHHCHGASRAVLGGNLVRLPIDGTLAAIASMRNRSLSLGMAGLALLVLALFLFFQRLVNRPVKTLLDLTARISNGDLTARVAVTGRDEISHICNRMNDMAASLGAMFGTIKHNSDAVGVAAAQLTAIAHQTGDLTDQVNLAAATVNTAATQMSADMHAASGAMEASSASTNMVAASTEQMSATIGEIAQSTAKARQITDQAVAQAANASQTVTRLGEAAQQIGKVVETITEISEQVNLLALNATIEAARAGEAGRGFAVVANEIKELAKQTAAATVQIKTKVGAIQSDTEDSVAGIAGVGRVISDVNAIVVTIAAAVEQQSAATREISANVSQAAGGIDRVNHAVGQNTRSADQIAGQILQVNQAAVAIAGGMQRLQQQAGRLEGLSGELQAQMVRFTV